jgi:hypothetical protein
MSDYLVKDKFGDIDVRPLAARLAVELGGEVVQRPAGDEPVTWWADIKVGDALLGISRTRDCRIGVRIQPAGFPPPLMAACRRFDTPIASLDATRPVERLAADIKRRVIDAGADALANWREALEQERRRRSDLARTVKRIAAEIPAADVALTSDGESATFYLNNGSAYLSGTLYADGTLSVQRCGSIPADRLVAVVAALSGGED